MAKKPDQESVKGKVVQQSCECHSGRLVAIDKSTGHPIEPDFEKSITFLKIILRILRERFG